MIVAKSEPFEARACSRFTLRCVSLPGSKRGIRVGEWVKARSHFFGG